MSKAESSAVVVAMIVAAAQNGVIGRENQLPWHLPNDLKYFKRVTLGKPVIMGRNTFESIGRPLPGRCNIVVTRRTDYQPEGVRVVSSVSEAIALGREVALLDGAEEVMVIGGSQIYTAALPLVERIYLTKVMAAVEGDAHLPEIDWNQWLELASEEFTAEGANPYDYSFVVYGRNVS